MLSPLLTLAVGLPQVCDKACEVIKSGKYDVMILNFANCDMVGHTGVMAAAQKAVKVTDECVKKVLDAIKEKSHPIVKI